MQDANEERRRKALAAAIEKQGFNNTRAATASGVPESSLRSFLSGNTRSVSIETYEKLSDGIGVSIPNLLGLADFPEYTAPPTKAISEIDVRAGMGGGGEVAVTYVPDGNGGMIEADDTCGSWALPEDYLRSELRIKAEAARIIEVQGDSMEPILHAGDRVMINTADKRPTPPGVFALWDGFGVVVKRIEHIPNSEPPTIKIKSDNPNHDEYERMLDEINIIGRLVWYARRL